MSKIKCQMSKVNKVKLLSERTSGAPPVIFPFVCPLVFCFWYVKVQMPNVNKVKHLSERTSKVPPVIFLPKQIEFKFVWRKTWFKFKSCSAPNWLKCNFHWIFINTLSWIKLPTRASSFWKQSANLKWCLDYISPKIEYLTLDLKKKKKLYLSHILSRHCNATYWDETFLNIYMFHKRGWVTTSL